MKHMLVNYLYKKSYNIILFTTNLWALLSTFLVVMQQRLTIFLWGSPALDPPISALNGKTSRRQHSDSGRTNGGAQGYLDGGEKWRKCDVAHIEKGQWNREDDDYTGDLVGLPNSDQFSKEKSMIILGQYPKLVSCSTYMVRILYSNRPAVQEPCSFINLAAGNFERRGFSKHDVSKTVLHTPSECSKSCVVPTLNWLGENEILCSWILIPSGND